MADVTGTMVRGESRPIKGTASLDGGTLTIQGTPAPVCTLYDSAGTAVSGFNGVPVTGQSAAGETVFCFLDVDSTSLTEGFYTLVFTFDALGNDGVTRTYKPSIELEVTLLPATYRGIYPVIRECLQDSVTGIPDSDFDRSIERTIRKMLAPYSGQTYAILSATDRAWMDEAVGLKVAVRLHGPLSTGGAATALIVERNDTSTRQFAEKGTDERDRWEQEARQAFARISFVLAARALVPYRMFALAGRRRSQDDPESLLELAFGVDESDELEA